MQIWYVVSTSKNYQSVTKNSVEVLKFLGNKLSMQCQENVENVSSTQAHMDYIQFTHNLPLHSAH